MLQAIRNFETQREAMVRNQLIDRGIRDHRVLAAMRRVPRHEFIAPELQSEAYEDHPLPIGFGQTISQPYIVAAMLQHLALAPTDRALEIGSGSGYVTALLSCLCAEVYSIERHSELATRAQEAVGRLGYSNVHIKSGDGSIGWQEFATFDAILVSAATSQIPAVLFVQLREGGRMIAPVGPIAAQELQLIRKLNGESQSTVLEGCRFVPLVEGTGGQ